MGKGSPNSGVGSPIMRDVQNRRGNQETGIGNLQSGTWNPESGKESSPESILGSPKTWPSVGTFKPYSITSEGAESAGYFRWRRSLHLTNQSRSFALKGQDKRKTERGKDKSGVGSQLPTGLSTILRIVVHDPIGSKTRRDS